MSKIYIDESKNKAEGETYSFFDEGEMFNGFFSQIKEAIENDPSLLKNEESLAHIATTNHPPVKWDVYQNFDKGEFLCKCGCGRADMNPQLIEKLQQLRAIMRVPITITSGYRCKTYNAKVGGQKNSAHTRGNAADIAAPSSQFRFALLSASFELGFRRVGIYDGFIHVDIDDSLPQDVTWVG